MLNINFEGLAGALNKIQDFKTRATQVIAEAVEKAALRVEADAKDSCPVDTGRLRSSITTDGPRVISGEEITAKVGTNVEYAPFVEFGTKRQKAQPYLYPALAKNRPQLSVDISKGFRELMK